jgi:hypothetical protein
VQLNVPTAELRVKSVTLDCRDITGEALDLTGRDAVSGVVVTMTGRLTAVAGQVHERDTRRPGCMRWVLVSMR